MEGNILIVEDEKEIADLVEFYLSNEGFCCYKCYNGKEAADCIEKEKPDLAILDVMLPETSGFELCRKIRETEHYPIIILTAKDAEIDKITGLTIGADDYVTKPFLPLELVARVKAQLRRYKRYSAKGGAVSGETGEKEGVLVCGALHLDTGAHQCFINDEEIKLTPTEFTILRVLCEKKGNVVSAEELFHSLWEDEYYNKTNNSVTVHIRHLREKMGETAEKPGYIKTVWGVGYKIDA